MKKPFEAYSVGQCKSAEAPLDDREQMKLAREQITASDIAFQQALDNAIQAKLEVCSTSPSTELRTRKPRFISGHEFK